MSSLHADILLSSHLKEEIETRKRRIRERLTGQLDSHKIESPSIAFYIVYIASAAGFIIMCAIAAMG